MRAADSSTSADSTGTDGTPGTSSTAVAADSSSFSTKGQVETDAQRRQTMDRIEADRSHETDAALVRIMKTKKTLDHANLVAETIRILQVRFTPSPQFIKRRIERLIDADYLTRSTEPGQHHIYIYLA
ncbi:winged helix DNA-binding domain-containing protein [Ramicandelaber brevisporus]|nr:winged helix DNA-binding domain-containing protein [Ramicandelaber brevisporus]